ncbi:folD [Symbiodinium sp. CCMP2592]|nr:folD [Symbiodinium sp. CCMP2592]
MPELSAPPSSSASVPEYPLPGLSPPELVEAPPSYILDSSRSEADYVGKTSAINLSNRFYCVLRTRAIDSPVVVRSFAEYKRRSAISGLMDFAALTPASTGVVELLEFSWPPSPEGDGSRSCSCYVLMLRQDGFLLAVPLDFFSQEELAAAPGDGLRPGPSHVARAPPVALTEEGEWQAADGDPVAALLVDFPAAASQLLSPLDSDLFLGTSFVAADPSLYPLASDLLQQARVWILSDNAGPSSGYRTAASEAPDPKRAARPKRPTMTQLVQQQAALAEVVGRMSDQLERLQRATPVAHAAPAPAAQPAEASPPAPSGAALRRAPLASLLPALGETAQPAATAAAGPPGLEEVRVPPFQVVPKSLTQVLGPPPPARPLPTQVLADAPQIDLDAQLAAGIAAGELPGQGASSELTLAMMAQSRALLTLVNQISQGADPILDQTSASSASARGSQTRQRLQADLAALSGSFAERLRERGTARMAPAGVGSTEPFSLCRYFERYGGFGRQRDQGLVAWQVAIAFDLLMEGHHKGASDTLALLALFLDQQALDGSSQVAWLMTLLQDPPQALFRDGPVSPGVGTQPFSPLADQKWVTSALGFLREMDLIAAKRAEAKPKVKKTGADPPPEVPKAECPLDFDGEFTFSAWASSLVEADALCLPVVRSMSLSCRRPLTTLRFTAGFQALCGQNELVKFLAESGAGGLDYAGFEGPLSASAFVPHSTDGPEILRPFQPLRADTVVLHGRANWHMENHLPTDMLLAAREPAVLRTFAGTQGPAPSFERESREELHKLMLVWDAKSLLRLCPGPLEDRLCSRVFGSFKKPGQFRQIGDRRGQNALEARLEGVSHELPQGYLLTRLSVPRFTHQLLGSSTDRRDFYSQCRVSRARSFTNAVKPGFRLRDFLGTKACAEYSDWVASLGCGPWARPSTGPATSFVPRAALLDLDMPVHGCFAALFQGDASGVELATAAHASFLSAAGVLPSAEDGRLLAKHQVSLEGPWAGLVIDDFFSVSAEPISRDRSSQSQAEVLVRRAKQSYASEGVLGSDDKDIFSSEVFTCAGAECDSSAAAVRDGIVSVAAPAAKRLALSFCSLRAATFRCISQELASMLTGSWVAALMYRRCAMAVADKVFTLGLGFAGGDSGSHLVFASDASLAKGAYTSVRVPREVSANLWLSGDEKGFYTRLENPVRASLSARGLEPISAPQREEEDPWPPEPTLSKPPAQHYDVLSVGPGPEELLPSLRSLGLVCGPFVDASASEHFDLRDSEVIEWAGFKVLSSLLVLFQTAWRCRLPALFVVPGCSVVQAWPSFLQLLNKPGVNQRNLSACACRFCSQGFFKVLGSGFAASDFPCGGDLRCRPSGHLGVQLGRWCPSLVRALAGCLQNIIAAQPSEPHRAPGFESLVANDLLATGFWGVVASWAWREAEHINALEVRALLKVLPDRALAGGDERLVAIVDSSVTLGAFTKGRSATRLNTADDPTRDTPFSDFDATLGFPGEGPVQHRPGQDADRRQRRAESELSTGRPVLPRTKDNRARLLHEYDVWLRERGSSLHALGQPPLDAAKISSLLVDFGRELFDAGRPYWHYSESVNAVAAAFPSVRRQLQGAWDLAFTWLALEPHSHHVPMPLVLLLASLSCCLLWGWLREAGIFALAWGGILRIGEATSASRSDLILPKDVLYLQRHILLKIQEPKTRLRVARHQVAKVEPEDLVALIGYAFEDLQPGEKLWPRTPQTLRRRLDQILERLGVRAKSGERALDLGSFRPGGATHLLTLCEDSELVRRRGRWISHKVMEVYLQEVSSITFFPNQPLETRQRILKFAQAFPFLLDKAGQYIKQRDDLPEAGMMKSGRGTLGFAGFAGMPSGSLMWIMTFNVCYCAAPFIAAATMATYGESFATLATLVPDRASFRTLVPDRGSFSTLIPDRKSFETLQPSRLSFGTLLPDRLSFQAPLAEEPEHGSEKSSEKGEEARANLYAESLEAQAVQASKVMPPARGFLGRFASIRKSSAPYRGS